MFGTISNPYNQPQAPDFGKGIHLPPPVLGKYQTMKGNEVNALNFSLQYPPHTRLPHTMTKAGESQNLTPAPLPQNLTNVKYPQRSSVSHAVIDQPRIGVQLGMPDDYRDNPNSDWTRGVQYYTIYTGSNPKTEITPLVYPQAWRKSMWAQDSVNFPEVNESDVQDITDLSMDYSCKSCEIASASLGTPVMYSPRNPTAPLPVAAYPGEWPNIAYYTAKEIGTNTRDWPPPSNPIMDIQRRNAGLPTYPIIPQYDNQMLRELRHGFSFS